MVLNYLYNFKEASILNNAQFNFAPDGLPSFYGGTGAPTAIQIKLEFTETQVWTREDYNAGTDVDETYKEEYPTKDGITTPLQFLYRLFISSSFKYSKKVI